MPFQCLVSVEDCGSTLKQNWVNATCLRKVYSRPSGGLVLGQRRRRLAGTSVHRRQVLNECWPAPAMVVEEIHVEDFNLSPWFFS